MSPAVDRAIRTDAGLAAVLRVSVARLARRLRTERSPEDTLSPGAFSVLGRLAREGEQTVGELATSEHVQPPSMTRTVGCLVADGYVQRHAAEHDRRQVVVALTEKGSATVQAERRRRDEWLSRRLKEFTPEERDVLRAAAPLLERLSSA